MPSEFEVIARYFSRHTRTASLGIGDDAALVMPSVDSELAIACDTLVSGTHFFADVEPAALGHKSLAVNLSDIAAMGGRPRWALLAITLPEANAAWLEAFSEGFFSLAKQFGVELIGGDTSRGPLTITVTIIGEVVAGRALRRDQASDGDDLWVSGQIGSAALALQHLRGNLRLKGLALEQSMVRLLAPVPRVELGRALLGVASSAIDVSDGVLADAGHIAQCSGVGMDIHLADIPYLPELTRFKADPLFQHALLAGGDDYELLFTAAPDQSARIAAISTELALDLTRIGRVRDGSSVDILDENGIAMEISVKGHDHFA